MCDNKFLDKYRIQSSRATWHHYDGGVYFVTICTRNHIHYFGEISDGQMRLSSMGEIVCANIMDIPFHVSNVDIPLYAVMPNHVHLVVAISGVEKGTTTLGSVIRGFKAGVTKRAKENHFSFQWQSRYYDRIVRSQEELNRIGEYITNNVVKWDLECNHAIKRYHQLKYVETHSCVSASKVAQYNGIHVGLTACGDARISTYN